MNAVFVQVSCMTDNPSKTLYFYDFHICVLSSALKLIAASALALFYFV